MPLALDYVISYLWRRVHVSTLPRTLGTVLGTVQPAWQTRKHKETNVQNVVLKNENGGKVQTNLVVVTGKKEE